MKLTTAKKVEAIQLPKGKSDYIEFDDDIPGLGLRIREGGSRTWIFQYRIGSKQRRMVLGSAKSAQLNLAEIRLQPVALLPLPAALAGIEVYRLCDAISSAPTR